MKMITILLVMIVVGVLVSLIITKGSSNESIGYRNESMSFFADGEEIEKGLETLEEEVIKGVSFDIDNNCKTLDNGDGTYTWSSASNYVPYNNTCFKFEEYLYVTDDKGRIKFETLDGKICYIEIDYEKQNTLSITSASIEITKNKDSYYFTTDANEEVNSMNYILVCDDSKQEIKFVENKLFLFDNIYIDFNMAKEVQNITSAYDDKTKTITFSGDDLKMIDPTVQLNYTTTGNYNWTVPAGVSEVEVLVVAGGGGGGGTVYNNVGGGGGGGGGLIYNSSYAVTPSEEITIIVGAGGTGTASSSAKGVSGTNSSFGTLIAISGGGGGSLDTETGLNGGSGGGAAGQGAYAGGTGTVGQGNDGGEGQLYAGAGGGGAGAVGEDGAAGGSYQGGDGGVGLDYSTEFGTTYGESGWFAGGGGGGANTDGDGGQGGGGTANGGDGLDGSGGGGSAGDSAGGDGGSGIILFKYTQLLGINITNSAFNDTGIDSGQSIRLNTTVIAEGQTIDKVWSEFLYPNGTLKNYTMSQMTYIGCDETGTCDACGNETNCTNCSEASCNWTSGAGAVEVYTHNMDTQPGTGWTETGTDWWDGGSYWAVDGLVTDNDVVTYDSTWDLSNYTQCNATVLIQTDASWDAGEYICMDYSIDEGSTWNRDTGSDGGVLGMCMDGDTTDDGSPFKQYIIDIDDELGSCPSSFKVRFRAVASSSTEDGWVDTFAVNGESLDSCDGTLNCSVYSNETGCNNCGQCNWTDIPMGTNYTLVITPDEGVSGQVNVSKIFANTTSGTLNYTDFSSNYWLNFTVTSAGDSTPPMFNKLQIAGNPSEEAFGMDTSSRFYRNGTHQIEDWMYIEVNISDDVDIDKVLLEWKNATAWANYTMTNSFGWNWSINMSNQENYSRYTFNIYANDTSGNSIKYNWTFYDYESVWGTIKQWRKYVGLNGTPININSSQFYLYNFSYTSDQTNDRVLPHEQPTDGLLLDTGRFLYQQPTTSNELNCNYFVGAYIDETITINKTQIDNVYLHIWWSSNNTISNFTNFSVAKTTSVSLVNPDSPTGRLNSIDMYITNRTNGKANINLSKALYDNYTLEAKLWDLKDANFTDNDINLFTIIMGYPPDPEIPSPSIVSSSNYSSFIIINLPDNTTLQGLDTDSDGVSDFDELFTKYTDPKDSDTDDDGTPDNTDCFPLDSNDATVCDSCDTNAWDCTENCNVEAFDAGGDTITATGSGTITIEGDITNCNVGNDILIITGGCEVINSGGYQIC